MVATAVMNLEVKVAQASRRHFGPIFKAGRRGLLTVLLSVTRPHVQPCFAAIWPKLWVGHRGLLAILLRVPRSPRCHRFEEACFFRVSFLSPLRRDSPSEWLDRSRFWWIGADGKEAAGPGKSLIRTAQSSSDRHHIRRQSFK